MFQGEADEIEMKGGERAQDQRKHSEAKRDWEAGMLRFVGGAGYSNNAIQYGGGQRLSVEGV